MCTSIYDKRFFLPATLLFSLLPSSNAFAQDQHLDEAGHEGEEARNEVNLEDHQLRLLTIETAVVESGSAEAVVEAPATVKFNADRIALVGPLLDSRVLQVTRDLGDEVQQGDVLAVLESVELGQVKSAYLGATARLESRQAEFDRDQELARQQIISQAHLLETRAAYLEAQAEVDALRAELRVYGVSTDSLNAISVDAAVPFSRYNLTAPISGVIQHRNLVSGQTLSSNETPIQIVNTDSIWLYIDVFERNLAQLAPQQVVSFRLRALNDRVFRGTTNWISQELDEASRTIQVRAVIDNPDHSLRAGMFGTAQILTNSDRDQPLVPIDAVQTLDEGEQVVFVPGHGPGAYMARPVTTGQEAGGMVEINHGLSAGEQVVITGAFDLMSTLTSNTRSAAHVH